MLKSIDKQVSDNIVDQMSLFESSKRNKKIRKRKNSENKEEENKEKEKEKENKIESKIEVNENDIEILNIPNKKLRRRGSSISQPKFLKEIEEYVEQNMKEMYKAIEELKQSYEGEEMSIKRETQKEFLENNNEIKLFNPNEEQNEKIDNYKTQISELKNENYSLIKTVNNLKNVMRNIKKKQRYLNNFYLMNLMKIILMHVK